MDDSILNSVKKMLGITKEYAVFDQDIIIGINSALNTLTQIGVGPCGGFFITDALTTWDEFLGENPMLEQVKMYVYLKVKQVFDNDMSGSFSSAVDERIKELEWRISVQVDPGDKEN